MRVLVVAALVLLAVVWPSAARAHEARAGEVAIEILSATEARVALRSADIEAPFGCSFEQAMLRCPDGLAGRSVRVRAADVAFVRFSDGEATVVTKRAPAFELPGRAARPSVALRFLALGVEHVLGGLDHVLFLVALFWQAWTGRARTTARALGWTATAFTLGHSLTLGLSMTGALRVPPLVAEACIAWSLFLVALDTGTDGRARAPLAAAFGLVHGLGFAGAMAGTRLPEAARWTALAAFNLGIEAGQVALLALCLALARFVPHVARQRSACAWVVGATGATLFFLRAASLFR